MKRFIAGAGLAATIVTGAYTGGEVAGAQERAACDTPVVDETAVGDGSGALRQIIGDFEDHDTTVTVRIYGPNQFTKDGELYDFIDETYADCGWDDSHINVAFADNPGRNNDFYDLAIGEQPGMFINDGRIFDAESHLSSDLDDPTTSTQQDFAEFLDRLYPYDGADSQSTRTTNPSNETEDNGHEPLNIPIVPAVVAGIGVTALGGIGSRVISARRLLAMKKLTGRAVMEAEDKATQAIEGSDENMVDGAEDLLSIVHESDALSIRDALGKLQAAQGELDRAKEAFVDATHGRSFLPRLRKARPLSTSVTNAAEGVTQRADELRKQVDSFNSLMATLKDEQLPEASSLIDSVRANTDELATKGWQLAEFTEQLESLREKHQQAVTENERGYISGPATLVAEIVDSAHAIQAQLDTLDERHDNLVSTYKAQTSSMRQTPKLITDTKARVSSAVDTYGAENFADLNPDARLDELLASQRKAYTDLQPLTNILSIEALEAGETCITQFDETVAEIRKLSGEVDDRINAIAQLSEDLPVLYQELEMYLTDVVEDLDEFGDKTTDATRAEIMSLKSDIEASNQQVQTSKPNLHELSSQRESQQENLTKLAEKARAEAVEMGELWADVRQIPKETQAALDTLRTYTGANDDVSPTTHAAIASMSLPTIEPGDTRETLREQVALAQKLKQQVTGLRERAEADVAAAQRRREAARQAEIAEQAEEAERRRRNRARVSTPSLPRIGSSSHRSSSPSHSTSKRSSGSRPKGSSGGSKRRSGRI